jgi:nicotinate phosphoribosyltransferase
MSSIYAQSLALLTDLYQLTMAYGYWKKGLADLEAVFHLFFRKKPFQGEIAVAAGLEAAVQFIRDFRYTPSDLAYLEQLRLFEPAFLDYLSALSFTCSLDAMPEGTPVFPYEPLLRVQGPMLQAQLLESPLLNIVNFQTLIATKAARICWAARPDPVVEFGLRRAQGIDGALSASRAAFIGGCHSTSNVLAGKLFGIPVKGTHAHSWIMLFDAEQEAFDAWADVMPHNCIFLVDTYDSIAGVKRAMRTAKALRKRGCEMIGVRLDSGDLAHLSIEIRRLLDAEGFPKALIMASNELDESIVNDLKHQGAKIDLWGIGTNLVTGKDQPALDGVYKLAAIKDASGKWRHKLKISEQTAKVTDPGVLQVRRFFNDQGCLADMVFDIHTEPKERFTIVDHFDAARTKQISQIPYRDLLVPVLRAGELVYAFPTLADVREKTIRELAAFHPATRRFLYPQPYFSGLEKGLFEEKLALIEEIKRSAAP